MCARNTARLNTHTSRRLGAVRIGEPTGLASKQITGRQADIHSHTRIRTHPQPQQADRHASKQAPRHTAAHGYAMPSSYAARAHMRAYTNILAQLGGFKQVRTDHRRSLLRVAYREDKPEQMVRTLDAKRRAIEWDR